MLASSSYGSASYGGLVGGVSVFVPYTVNVSDGISVSGYQEVLLTSFADIADDVLISNYSPASITSLLLSLAIGDDISIEEFSQQGINLYSLFAYLYDEVGVVEDISLSSLISLSNVEIISINDQATGLLINNVDASDQVTITETIEKVKVLLAEISDSVLAGEDVSLETLINQYTFDEITAGEDTVLSIISSVNVYDETSISDVVEALHFFLVNVYDQMSTTEETFLDTVINLSPYDIINVDGEPTLFVPVNVSVQDNVQINEYIKALKVLLTSIYEDVSLSDIPEIRSSIDLYPSEVISIIEDTTLFVPVKLSVLEEINIEDVDNVAKVVLASIYDQVVATEDTATDSIRFSPELKQSKKAAWTPRDTAFKPWGSGTSW
jgi:hypothetical protein